MTYSIQIFLAQWYSGANRSQAALNEFYEYDSMYGEFTYDAVAAAKKISKDTTIEAIDLWAAASPSSTGEVEKLMPKIDLSSLEESEKLPPSRRP